MQVLSQDPCDGNEPDSDNIGYPPDRGSVARKFKLTGVVKSTTIVDDTLEGSSRIGKNRIARAKVVINGPIIVGQTIKNTSITTNPEPGGSLRNNAENWGKFEINLTAGSYNYTASADGYTNTQGTLEVTEDLEHHILMLKPLAVGQLQVVTAWPNRNPRLDLDAYLGPTGASNCDWVGDNFDDSTDEEKCDGIDITHDMDDTGYRPSGPVETITLSNTPSTEWVVAVELFFSQHFDAQVETKTGRWPDLDNGEAATDEEVKKEWEESEAQVSIYQTDGITALYDTSHGVFGWDNRVTISDKDTNKWMWYVARIHTNGTSSACDTDCVRGDHAVKNIKYKQGVDNTP